MSQVTQPTVSFRSQVRAIGSPLFALTAPLGGLSLCRRRRGIPVALCVVGVLLASAAPAGAVTFAPKSNFAAGADPASVAVGDFNADGDPDLATANFVVGSVSVLLGGAGGGFGPKTDFAAGDGAHSVAVGDFNADGDPDLATANLFSDNVSVLLNASVAGLALSPASLAFGAQPVGTLGAPLTVTVTNTGESVLRVSSAATVGANRTDFIKVKDSCTGQPVARNATCTVSLRFAPSGTGARSAALRLTSDAPGSPPEAALSGTGSPTPTDPNVINGTSGNDTINGTPGNDVINCGAGNDVVNGGAGNDVINCGAGNDRVSGGSGNDRVSGQSGRDRLRGNSGRDRVSGGSGNDRASGDSGNDRVAGDSGRDRLSGGSGNDRLAGGSGNDRLNGDRGRDRLSGGRGDDRLNGGPGRDRLNGGPGRDRQRQ